MLDIVVFTYLSLSGDLGLSEGELAECPNLPSEAWRTTSSRPAFVSERGGDIGEKRKYMFVKAWPPLSGRPSRLPAGSPAGSPGRFPQARAPNFDICAYPFALRISEAGPRRTEIFLARTAPAVGGWAAADAWCRWLPQCCTPRARNVQGVTGATANPRVGRIPATGEPRVERFGDLPLSAGSSPLKKSSAVFTSTGAVLPGPHSESHRYSTPSPAADHAQRGLAVLPPTTGLWWIPDPCTCIRAVPVPCGYPSSRPCCPSRRPSLRKPLYSRRCVSVALCMYSIIWYIHI